VLADSLFKSPDRADEYLTHAFSDYAVSQNDRVLAGGHRRWTIDVQLLQTVNVGGFASIGVIDQDHARRWPGADGDLEKARWRYLQAWRRTTNVRPRSEPPRQHHPLTASSCERVQRQPKSDHCRLAVETSNQVGLIAVERTRSMTSGHCPETARGWLCADAARGTLP